MTGSGKCQIAWAAYSAAAAWLAHLQVYTTPLLKLNVDVVIAPLIFCPGRLFPIQHYVGPEPVHPDGCIQVFVQIIQGCLHVMSIQG